MLTLSGTSLRGIAGPRQISCTIRASSPGLRVPPGTYQLVVGPSNPLHGTVLLLLSPEARAAAERSYSLAYEKIKTSVTQLDQPPRSSLGAKVIKSIDKSSAELYVASSSGQPAAFAVVAKPISGQSCLVVDAGFSSLVDSVTTSGSITVKVL